MPCVPGKRMQAKSTPGFFFAAMNSPLAQSPIIWKPALPLITIPEATFQSRPEKSLSTSLRSWPMRSKAFSIVAEPSAVLSF